MTRSSQRGLTLPELLIALLIFAMISGVAVYALRLSVEGRSQLEEADAAIRDMQIARVILKQDLAQLAPRIIRDEFGNKYPASFLGGDGLAFRPPHESEKLLMAFVRRGWENPEDRSPRSTLQAVEYLIVGDVLVRRVRPYLDDARDQPRTDRILLAGVGATSIQFFAGEISGRLNWVDLWPAISEDAPPKAVRLSTVTDRFGELEQIFWIGEAPE